MVFVQIRSVMVLSSRHTSSTGMFAVFAHATVAGGDMAPTREREGSASVKSFRGFKGTDAAMDAPVLEVMSCGLGDWLTVSESWMFG